MTPKHHGVYTTEPTTFWHGSDSRATFDNHLKIPEKRQALADQGWINADISYKFNAHGFRCEEFDQRPCGIALGCSFTFGTGLPESATWPFKITEDLGLHIWNLGIGGGAYDTVFRIACEFIPYLKPQVVLLCEPPPGRIEFELGDGQYTVITASNIDKTVFAKDRLIRHWFANASNISTNLNKNRLAIKQLCQEHNTQLYVWTPRIFVQNHVDHARDLIHAGPRSQDLVTEEILKQIKI